jgi:hypothetical protein
MREREREVERVILDLRMSLLAFLQRFKQMVLNTKKGDFDYKCFIIVDTFSGRNEESEGSRNNEK